jgi:DNA repair protein RadD
MFELRWYQQEAVNSLFDFYSQDRELVDDKPQRKNALVCLPTGTGKSLIIADFIKRLYTEYPQARVLMSTHVKELIEQDAKKLLEYWPVAPLGIFSAGIGRKEIHHPIIFGGVQSMVKADFGFRDFLIVDEAHLIGDEGNYLKLIDNLLLRNPYLKIIGLSATPYRQGMGLITNGKIFTDVVYDMCNREAFLRLLADGFICPLIPQRGEVEINTDGIHIVNGDYNQKELAEKISKQKIFYKALSQAVTVGKARRSWIVFAASVENAEEIAEILNNAFQISTVVLHSKKSKAENDAAMLDWKKGVVQCAVNVGMLTTGVDHPALDFIVMLRPTMSTGLWVQSLGRGTRPCEGKLDCLVMDFAGNTARLGPIDDPVLPKRRGERTEPGLAPIKECAKCHTFAHISAKECAVCGFVFPIQSAPSKLQSNFSKNELMLAAKEPPNIQKIKVDRVIYQPHKSKRTGANCIKVSYYCGPLAYTEYTSVEGVMGNIKGRNWFRQRYDAPPPETNAEVLALMDKLRVPSYINVWVNKKPYFEIISSEF